MQAHALKPIKKIIHALFIGVTFTAFNYAGISNTFADTVVNVKRTYNIQAGLLTKVISEFAAESDILLSANAELADGKTSKGLKGSYTVEEGFAAILSGSGLVASRNASGGYTIEKPALESRDNPAMLPEVAVRSTVEQETAVSPVRGFVAKRNATATKTDTPVIETPQSISIVTNDEMDARGVRDVGQAAAYTAGVFSGSQGETTLFGGNAVQIRGFGATGTAGLSFNEYLDGLRLNGTGFAGANLDPYLFERIEVLKGPASVLFGQTQPGGIVNMVSKRPREDMVNEVRLGTGNRDHMNGTFDVGGALSEDALFRVTGLALDGDTQQEHSERKRQLLAPSLTWANDKTSLTLLAHYQRDDINATILSVVPASGLFSNPNGRVSPNFRVGDPNYEFWNRQTWSFGYLFSHAFSDALTVRQNLRYTHNQLDSDWLYRRSLNADRRTLNRSAFSATEDAGNLAIDNQLQWKVATGPVQHTVLAGIDYRRTSKKSLLRFGTVGVPTIDLFNPVYNRAIPTQAISQNTDTVEQQIGTYLQNQMKIGALSLLAGGRYDDAQSTIDDRQTNATTTQRSHAFTGRLGAIYNFANGVAPYVSYAQSFEPITGLTFGGTRFIPMEGEQYELGVKYQPADSNHLLTLALFDLTQQNMTTNDPANPGFSIQVGEVRTRGLEIEEKASFDNGLSLTAAYTFLDDEVTKSNNTSIGTRRAQIPRHSASLWADYTVRTGSLAGLGVGVGTRYIGETQGDRAGTNVFEVPGYTLFDAALRYDLSKSPLALKGWKLDVTVNNLFDKEYVASCFATHSCYIGVGRTARASLRYTW